MRRYAAALLVVTGIVVSATLVAFEEPLALVIGVLAGFLFGALVAVRRWPGVRSRSTT